MACTTDFRCLDEGFGGKTAKRKRESQEQAAADADEASMDIDSAHPPSAKRSAVASSEDPDKPVAVAAIGKPTYDGVIAGKVSGRNWKTPRTHRSSGRFVRNKGPDLEEMKRQREIKKAYRERKNELKEEIRSHKVEKRKKKEEREKRKAENVLRTGTKLQKITNPKTLKKIAKSKQRKHLKVIPDEVVNGNKKSINNYGCKCNSFEDASMLLEELRLFDNQVYGVVHGLLKGHGQNVWLQARSLFDKVNEMDGSAASSFYNALTNMLRCSGTLVRKYHTDIVKAKFWN
ncbi:hypothetical protein IGI04_010217 [Brassica rapa subsp. trilocularis]|uniref:Coiled-coil domain-containing protein 86 n=1 Tax=Brassica rapa subsp. trilocularis TaxID=1813537 RepID=A0ABQ7N0M1_BRACM|nr:hypothetical protein IGI04_010217 [Brassica rapa subsp. trilocularis]